MDQSEFNNNYAFEIPNTVKPSLYLLLDDYIGENDGNNTQFTIDYFINFFKTRQLPYDDNNNSQFTQIIQLLKNSQQITDKLNQEVNNILSQKFNNIKKLYNIYAVEKYINNENRYTQGTIHTQLKNYFKDGFKKLNDIYKFENIKDELLKVNGQSTIKIGTMNKIHNLNNINIIRFFLRLKLIENKDWDTSTLNKYNPLQYLNISSICDNFIFLNNIIYNTKLNNEQTLFQMAKEDDFKLHLPFTISSNKYTQEETQIINSSHAISLYIEKTENDSNDEAQYNCYIFNSGAGGELHVNGLDSNEKWQVLLLKCDIIKMLQIVKSILFLSNMYIEINKDNNCNSMCTQFYNQILTDFKFKKDKSYCYMPQKSGSCSFYSVYHCIYFILFKTYKLKNYENNYENELNSYGIEILLNYYNTQKKTINNHDLNVLNLIHEKYKIENKHKFNEKYLNILKKYISLKDNLTYYFKKSNNYILNNLNKSENNNIIKFEYDKINIDPLYYLTFNKDEDNNENIDTIILLFDHIIDIYEYNKFNTENDITYLLLNDIETEYSIIFKNSTIIYLITQIIKKILNLIKKLTISLDIKKILDCFIKLNKINNIFKLHCSTIMFPQNQFLDVNYDTNYTYTKSDKHDIYLSLYLFKYQHNIIYNYISILLLNKINLFNKQGLDDDNNNQLFNNNYKNIKKSYIYNVFNSFNSSDILDEDDFEKIYLYRELLFGEIDWDKYKHSQPNTLNEIDLLNFNKFVNLNHKTEDEITIIFLFIKNLINQDHKWITTIKNLYLSDCKLTHKNNKIKLKVYSQIIRTTFGKYDNLNGNLNESTQYMINSNIIGTILNDSIILNLNDRNKLQEYFDSQSENIYFMTNLITRKNKDQLYITINNFNKHYHGVSTNKIVPDVIKYNIDTTSTSTSTSTFINNINNHYYSNKIFNMIFIIFLANCSKDQIKTVFNNIKQHETNYILVKYLYNILINGIDNINDIFDILKAKSDGEVYIYNQLKLIVSFLILNNSSIELILKFYKNILKNMKLLNFKKYIKKYFKINNTDDISVSGNISNENNDDIYYYNTKSYKKSFTIFNEQCYLSLDQNIINYGNFEFNIISPYDMLFKLNNQEFKFQYDNLNKPQLFFRFDNIVDNNKTVFILSDTEYIYCEYYDNQFKNGYLMINNDKYEIVVDDNICLSIYTIPYSIIVLRDDKYYIYILLNNNNIEFFPIPWNKLLDFDGIRNILLGAPELNNKLFEIKNNYTGIINPNNDLIHLLNYYGNNDIAYYYKEQLNNRVNSIYCKYDDYKKSNKISNDFIDYKHEPYYIEKISQVDDLREYLQNLFDLINRSEIFKLYTININENKYHINKQNNKKIYDIIKKFQKSELVLQENTEINNIIGEIIKEKDKINKYISILARIILQNYNLKNESKKTNIINNSKNYYQYLNLMNIKFFIKHLEDYEKKKLDLNLDLYNERIDLICTSRTYFLSKNINPNKDDQDIIKKILDIKDLNIKKYTEKENKHDDVNTIEITINENKRDDVNTIEINENNIQIKNKSNQTSTIQIDSNFREIINANIQNLKVVKEIYNYSKDSIIKNILDDHLDSFIKPHKDINLVINETLNHNIKLLFDDLLFIIINKKKKLKKK